MNTLGQAVLLGWVPAMLVLFALVPVRVAVLVAGIGGWLLLPQGSFPLPGLSNYEKSTAISFAMLAGCLTYAPGELAALRPSWRDLPMAVWIASAFVSAVANDTGAYDGASAATYRLVDWGIPYWIGRAYFASAAHLRLVTWGLFLGGLAYVVPCLWEIRMSPQLHAIFYGSHQHSWEQTLRGGGYRPLVFTPHGLALSLWMAIATIAGAHLWRQRAARHLLGLPIGVLVVVLGGTMVLCKSLGATLLMVFGLLLVLAPFGRPLLAATVVLVPTYLLMRMTHVGGVDELLAAWSRALPPDRAQSLQFRLENEAVLIDRAWLQPWVGWTPWSFLQPIPDEWGELRLLVCDSMWIIHFACNGILGLASVIALLLAPGLKAVLRTARTARTAVRARGDDLFVLSVIVTVFLVDCLVNAFLVPAYLVAAGAVIGAPATEPVAGRAEQQGAVRALPEGVRLRPRLASAATLRPRWTEQARR